MSYHLLTVASIKMGISLSLGAMIVLVKFGILILEICYIHSKVIKMQSILWLLMCLMEIVSQQGHSIRLLNFGTPKQDNVYLHSQVIKTKL